MDNQTKPFTKPFKCKQCGCTRRNENIKDAAVCWRCGEVQGLD